MTRAVETRGGTCGSGRLMTVVVLAIAVLALGTAPASARPSNGGDCTRCHKQGPPNTVPVTNPPSSGGVDDSSPPLPAPGAETEQPSPAPAAPAPSAASPTTPAPTQQPETSPSSGLSSRQPAPRTSTQQPANSSPATTPPAPNPARDATTATGTTSGTGAGNTAATTPAASPHPGDFAEDLARAEAERNLPPPLPVVRIDRPEFVFSGADPVIAAGVAAWLATVEGPHDQYGTFMGPGYTGSYRPDSVNSQLIAFLANFCKDKRLVAVSEGQAAALAAAQEQSRRDAVEASVNARREAASRPASPASSSTNGRENVPAIGGGSDRSRPASTAPAATTSS